MVLNFKQIYLDSWDVFKKNWWEFIVVTIIMGLFSIIPFIGNILQLFMYILVLNAVLKVIKGETISFSSFFNFKEVCNQRVITIFVIVAILGLVLQALSTDTTAAIILSVIIFILTVLLFPLFCVMLDKDISVKEVFSNSLQLTKGARIDIIILMILDFVIGILGVILLLVGVLVAIPIITIATVQAYKSLQAK